MEGVGANPAPSRFFHNSSTESSPLPPALLLEYNTAKGRRSPRCFLFFLSFFLFLSGPRGLGTIPGQALVFICFSLFSFLFFSFLSFLSGWAAGQPAAFSCLCETGRVTACIISLLLRDNGPVCCDFVQGRTVRAQRNHVPYRVNTVRPCKWGQTSDKYVV